MNTRIRATLSLAFALIVGTWSHQVASQPSRSMLRIAHAGGGFDSMTYTNSIDALNANAALYDLFEIDLSFTRDWELVCIHDWDHSAKKVFGKAFASPPSLAEFQALVVRNKNFKNCTLKTLIDWLDAHPGKAIVTDVKSHNRKALTLIAQRFPEYRHKFIPQIYHPLEYEAVKRLGYEKIIWTLYRYGLPAEVVVDKARHMELFAVAMPTSRADAGLADLLSVTLGIESYVHTINTHEELARYRSLGISGIYTDWLAEHREDRDERDAR